MARSKSSDNNKQVFWIILALVIAVLLFGGFLSKEQVAVEASHENFDYNKYEPASPPSSSPSSFMSPCRALSSSYPNDTVETTYPGDDCKPIVCYVEKADQYYVYPTCTNTNGNPVNY